MYLNDYYIEIILHSPNLLDLKKPNSLDAELTLGYEIENNTNGIDYIIDFGIKSFLPTHIKTGAFAGLIFPMNSHELSAYVYRNLDKHNLAELTGVYFGSFLDVGVIYTENFDNDFGWKKYELGLGKVIQGRSYLYFGKEFGDFDLWHLKYKIRF